MEGTLEQKAVEIITNLQDLAQPAMQLTLEAVRFGAAIDVSLSAAYLIAIYFASRFVGRTIYPAWKAADSEISEFGGLIFLIIGGLTAVVTSVAAIVTLFSASTWLAIFSPEMALARMLLSKATS